MGMHVHLNNPDLQAKIEQWASDTGRPADELVEDVMAGYFEERAKIRQTLDRRYDDIKSGNVKLIPGDEVEAHFAAKSAARQNPSARLNWCGCNRVQWCAPKMAFLAFLAHWGQAGLRRVNASSATRQLQPPSASVVA